MASKSFDTEYLLLDDVEVPATRTHGTGKLRKSASFSSSASLPRRFKTPMMTVPKGALISLVDGDCFKIEKSSAKEIQSETLWIAGGICKDKIVAVSDKERRMLHALKDDASRYEVYSSGRLKWACGLKPGDNVLVKLPTSMSPINAILRSSGIPDRLYQPWKFQVEIMEEGFQGYAGESVGNFSGRMPTCDNLLQLVSVDKLYSQEALKRPDLPSTKNIKDTIPSDNVDGKSLVLRGIEIYEQTIQRLKEEHQCELIVFQQQKSTWNKDNSALKDELEKKRQEITQLEEMNKESKKLQGQLQQSEAHLSQQLEEQQDQHQQVEMQLQKEIQETRQQNTQLQQRLADEKEELQAHLQQQLRQQQDQHKEVEIQLQHQLSMLKQENQSLLSSQQESIAFGIEPWKVPREAVMLDGVIGGGGWGSVHKGRLQVAVKQFYPNIMSEQNIARLKREMQMLALIRHPNLLQFIAAVFDENEDHRKRPPYIITELLGMNLRSAYEDAKLPSHSLLSIFIDIARALDYLHRRHEPIIHRDVSSANVLLKQQPNEKWIAKLSDLGSANLAREAYTMNEGSRVYCAPEAFTFDPNARSQGALTPKVDVYSYGIMLCEVATSTFPDETKYPSLLARVRHEWPQLHPLIIACTNQSLEQRPTMESVLDSLQTFPAPT